MVGPTGVGIACGPCANRGLRGEGSRLAASKEGVRSLPWGRVFSDISRMVSRTGRLAGVGARYAWWM